MNSAGATSDVQINLDTLVIASLPMLERKALLQFVTAMASCARTSMCASTVVRNYVIRRVPVTAQQLPARTILGVTRSIKLVGAIHHDKESFDRNGISLSPVSIDEWQGLLFVNIDANAEPLIDWLGNLYSKPRELEQFEMGSLKSVHTSIDEVQANWKVLVENYSECLHCSVVHPELCETVPVYKTGKTTQDERPDWGASLAEGKTAISFAQDENLPLIASMDDMDDYSVFGSYVYPNMLIDVMPTCVAVSTYIPRSATHTTVITDYLFPAEVAINPPVDLKPTLDFNELVNQQDFAVSERVQRGVASKAFRQAYHTEMEKYAQRFVKQYREDTKTN